MLQQNDDDKYYFYASCVITTTIKYEHHYEDNNKFLSGVFGGYICPTIDQLSEYFRCFSTPKRCVDDDRVVNIIGFSQITKEEYDITTENHNNLKSPDFVSIPVKAETSADKSYYFCSYINRITNKSNIINSISDLRGYSRRDQSNFLDSTSHNNVVFTTNYKYLMDTQLHRYIFKKDFGLNNAGKSIASWNQMTHDQYEIFNDWSREDFILPDPEQFGKDGMLYFFCGYYVDNRYGHLTFYYPDYMSSIQLDGFIKAELKQSSRQLGLPIDLDTLVVMSYVEIKKEHYDVIDNRSS